MRDVDQPHRLKEKRPGNRLGDDKNPCRFDPCGNLVGPLVFYQNDHAGRRLGGDVHREVMSEFIGKGGVDDDEVKIAFGTEAPRFSPSPGDDHRRVITRGQQFLHKLGARGRRGNHQGSVHPSPSFPR